jgi:hypothetical protein
MGFKVSIRTPDADPIGLHLSQMRSPGDQVNIFSRERQFCPQEGPNGACSDDGDLHEFDSVTGKMMLEC